MAQLPLLYNHLINLGIDNAFLDADTLLAETNQVKIHAREVHDSLRLEVQLLEEVVRSRVALWNIIHHNNNLLPFGQFYISPNNAVCIGLKLPARPPFTQWLERILFELITAAESYLKQVQADFALLPFHEDDLRPNLGHLIRSGLTPSWPVFSIGRDEAAAMVERMLLDQFGSSNVIVINKYEYGLTLGENLSTFTVESLPFIRKHRLACDWHMGLRTEVGVLDNTDEKLWIRLNRLNYESFMLAYAIRYNQRKPVISLTTEFIPEFIQHPQLLQAALDNHMSCAGNLLGELQAGNYRISNVINYKLGLK
jgi:hypothetical protein